MKIGIAGPNKIEKGTEKRKKLLDKTAKIISNTDSEIVLTPDRESLLEFFGKKYLEYGGKKVKIIAPMKDDAEEYLNLELGETIDCSKWDRQAEEFNEQCDLILCLGYAWGAMKEIASAQYFNKKNVYIVKEFISKKLPSELNFLVEYIPTNKINEKINLNKTKIKK